MTTPARILVLIDSLLAGGAERLAVETACALDRSRFTPHIVVTRHGGPLQALVDAAGVECTVLDRTRSLDVAAWRRAHRIARSSDLIHAHKFGSNTWGALLARTAGTPLVAHEHNFAAVGSRRRALVDRRWIAPAASRVLCVSESVARLQRSHGVPDHLIEIVPNGVRLEAAWPRSAARAELALDDAETVVGIVGRLRPEKAHEVLLEAVARLNDAGRPLRLCIVGDGPRDAELRELAMRLGIMHLVEFSGERQDAARLAAAFDISVICSHWEGMPLAALEALAAGVPLVASAVGGLVDLLEGDAGSLVAPGDPAGLAGAIAALLDDPEHARQTARAGQQRVREQHSFRGMVRRIESIYEAVLESSARSAGSRRRARARAGASQRQEAA